MKCNFFRRVYVKLYTLQTFCQVDAFFNLLKSTSQELFDSARDVYFERLFRLRMCARETYQDVNVSPPPLTFQ